MSTVNKDTWLKQADKEFMDHLLLQDKKDIWFGDFPEHRKIDPIDPIKHQRMVEYYENWINKLNNKMKVNIKKFRENAVIPQQGTKLAGGWDVTAADITENENGTVSCKLGFGIQMPPNYRLIVSPRSSFTKTNWVLQNSPCLVDADYTGELMLVFRSIGNDTFPYQIGDRVAQCYLEEVIPIEFEEVEELAQTERGSGGYGSTGK